MRKIFALVLFAASVQAGELLPEFRISYFRPSSHVMREIYHTFVGYEFQGNYFFSSCNRVLNHLGIFVDVEYLSSKGRSLGGHNRTSIWMVPVTVGLKWIQPVACKFDVYVGAGPRYFFVETCDHSPYVKPEIDVSGIGGMVEGGVYFAFFKCVTLDAFVGYSFRELTHHAKYPLEGHTVQVGGLSIGGGVGWYF